MMGMNSWKLVVVGRYIFREAFRLLQSFSISFLVNSGIHTGVNKRKRGDSVPNMDQLRPLPSPNLHLLAWVALPMLPQGSPPLCFLSSLYSLHVVTFTIVAGLETHLGTVLAASLVGTVCSAVATPAPLLTQAEHAVGLATWLPSAQVFARQLSLEADAAGLHGLDAEVQPLAFLLHHLLQLLSQLSASSVLASVLLWALPQKKLKKNSFFLCTQVQHEPAHGHPP